MSVSMMIFGSIGIFRRFIPLSSGLLSFIRGMTGALFLLVFMKAKGMPLRNGIGRRKLLWLALSGAAIGFNWILLFEAYGHTSVPVATLCYYMQPTIVILLSPLLLKERLTKRNVICAAAAIFGMVLVSGAAEDPQSAAAVLIPYLLLTEDFGAIRITLAQAGLVLVVGLVHTGIAYTMYFGSMDGLRGQTVAMLSYIDPVTALILSAIILHESLSVLGVIGAVMILGSAAASAWRSS